MNVRDQSIGQRIVAKIRKTMAKAKTAVAGHKTGPTAPRTPSPAPVRGTTGDRSKTRTVAAKSRGPAQDTAPSVPRINVRARSEQPGSAKTGVEAGTRNGAALNAKTSTETRAKARQTDRPVIPAGVTVPHDGASLPATTDLTPRHLHVLLRHGTWPRAAAFAVRCAPIPVDPAPGRDLASSLRDSSPLMRAAICQEIVHRATTRNLPGMAMMWELLSVTAGAALDETFMAMAGRRAKAFFEEMVVDEGGPDDIRHDDDGTGVSDANDTRDDRDRKTHREEMRHEDALARLADLLQAPGGADPFRYVRDEHRRRHSFGVSFGLPVPVGLLEHERWDTACGALVARTLRIFGQGFFIGLFGDAPYLVPGNRDRSRQEISVIVTCLQALHLTRKDSLIGELRLAWHMLRADPNDPSSLHGVMPQLDVLVREMTVVTNPAQKASLERRLQVWWLIAARKRVEETPYSLFCIAACAADGGLDEDLDEAIARWLDVDATPREDDGRQDRDHDTDGNTDRDSDTLPDTDLPASLQASPAPSSSTLVVMPQAGANRRHLPPVYQALIGKPLPLCPALNLHALRAALLAEYPHAAAVIAGLLRDLREGEPLHLHPLLLVGDPGCGKSRLVRRLGELTGLYVYRFNATAALDGHFGGVSKGWSSADACVPMRAVMTGKIANPLVLLDEIDKAATSTRHGRLWDALLPFLERETARSCRDIGIDCDLDLSRVSYVATANATEVLPAPLRDRFRILRMPRPTLDHLPVLAAGVMRDLAMDDEGRRHDAPLAPDELAVIARAWEASHGSLRRLRQIVAATLVARDDCARRH